LRDVTSFDIAVNGTNSYLWKIFNDELTTDHSLMSMFVTVPPPPSGLTTGYLMGLSVSPMRPSSLTLLGLTSRCRTFSKQILICACALDSLILLVPS
jgi:hypothetical protein